MARTEHEPEPGDKYVRGIDHYRILEVDSETVRMTKTFAGQEVEVEVTRERFDEEVRDGNAVWHPECKNCGFTFNPNETHSGVEQNLHYWCWYEQASVEQRCREEDTFVAKQASQTDNAKQFLLNFIGNPAKSFHNRVDAENLLIGNVETSVLIEASVTCPNCRNGEQFRIDPGSGAVSCHCGEQLKPPDNEE